MLTTILNTTPASTPTFDDMLAWIRANATRKAGYLRVVTGHYDEDGLGALADTANITAQFADAAVAAGLGRLTGVEGTTETGLTLQNVKDFWARRGDADTLELRLSTHRGEPNSAIVYQAVAAKIEALEAQFFSVGEPIRVEI